METLSPVCSHLSWPDIHFVDDFLMLSFHVYFFRASLTCCSCSRHTFGTLLNANGENPKVVQELLRHASLKVTTDVYMQAVGPQKREAQNNLVRLVRKGFDPEVKSS